MSVTPEQVVIQENSVPAEPVSSLKPKKRSIIKLIFPLLVIGGLFATAFLLMPGDGYPMDLSLGTLGKSLPEKERYTVLEDGRKVERFPIVYKKNRKLPFKGAYRIAVYFNGAFLMQKDIHPSQLDEGVVGFTMDRKGNTYMVVFEAMNSGDDIQAISKSITFTY